MTDCPFFSPKTEVNQRPPLSTMSKTAEILVGGVRFLIDESDLELIGSYRWCLYDNGRGHKYAQTTVKAEGVGTARQRTVRLHRFVLGLHAGDRRIADHINGDTTDNRRANLRVVDQTLNNINRARKNGGPMKTKAGWIVRTKSNGKAQYHGYFTSLEQAQEVFRNVIGDGYAR